MATWGILAACAAVMLARRLGYEWKPAARPLWWAVGLFAGSMALQAFGLSEQEEGFFVAGHLATAVGAFLLFVSVTTFEAGPGGASRQAEQ